MLAGVALDPEPDLAQGDKDSMATRTDRKLAKESGISHNTLSRIAKIEEKATEEQKKALEKNEASNRWAEAIPNH